MGGAQLVGENLFVQLGHVVDMWLSHLTEKNPEHGTATLVGNTRALKRNKLLVAESLRIAEELARVEYLEHTRKGHMAAVRKASIRDILAYLFQTLCQDPTGGQNLAKQPRAA